MRLDRQINWIPLTWTLASIKRFADEQNTVAQLIIDTDLSKDQFEKLNTNLRFSLQHITIVLTRISNEFALNACQLQAITTALHHHVTCIQGPPGTGKTRVIQAFCKAMLLLKELSSDPLEAQLHMLVSAHSNYAVANLQPLLLGRGINILRWGNAKRSQPTEPDGGGALNHWIECLVEAEGKSANNKIWRERQRQLIRASPDSVCMGTCDSMGSSNLNLLGPFVGSASIDEAGLAPEPSLANVWSRLTKKGSTVLVGDQCQLPPIVQSQQAKYEGLNTSILERLSRLPGIKCYEWMGLGVVSGFRCIEHRCGGV